MGTNVGGMVKEEKRCLENQSQKAEGPEPHLGSRRQHRDEPSGEGKNQYLTLRKNKVKNQEKRKAPGAVF